MRLFAMATSAMLLLAVSAPALSQPTTDTPRFVRCSGPLVFYLPGDYYFCRGADRQMAGQPTAALDYFERAAAWGHKKAQYLLGLMHFQGDGTQVDRPLGLAWLTLAAERDDRDIDAALAFARRHVSSAERAQAEQLLATMRLTYADAVTVERATTRYERETRALRRSQIYDPFSPIYIAGFGVGSASSMLRKMDQRAEVFFEGARGGDVAIGGLEVVSDDEDKPEEDPSGNGER